MTCPICNDTGFYTVGKWPRKYNCDSCLFRDRRKYAGIGSRETPNAVISQMKMISAMFGVRGLLLRSGHAKPPMSNRKPDTFSADLAFEEGAKSVGGATQIRTATTSVNALEHAAQFHPNWAACDHYTKTLHARNSLIMCGDLLDQPVQAVVCWTDGGGVKGGTGQALRVAAGMGIPVFNLWHPNAFTDALAFFQ